MNENLQKVHKKTVHVHSARHTQCIHTCTLEDDCGERKK